MLNTVIRVMAVAGLAASVEAPAGAATEPAHVDASTAPYQRGKALYEEACLGCHGRQLEGGIGPNLSDHHWLHGEQTPQIIANIQTGFSAKGMPAFGSIFNSAQLDDLVAYIRSQQRGWSYVNYELRPLKGYVTNDFDYATLAAIKPTKTGQFADAIADFGIAEIPYYALSVSGELNIPHGFPVVMHIPGWNAFDIYLEIDGERQVESDWKYGPVFSMPAGKHQVTLIYASSAKDNANGKDIVVMLSDPPVQVFYSALTHSAKSLLNQARFEVLATSTPKISRRRTDILSGSPILVGLPEAWNFAFDTRSCEIVGAWQGDFLDIGPNISSRSSNPAQVLGKWAFHSPEAIKTRFKNDATHCHFVAMDTFNGQQEPMFHYQLNGVETTLRGKSEQGKLLFHYQFAVDHTRPLSISVPKNEQSRFRYQNNALQSGVLNLVLDKNHKDVLITLEPNQ